MRIRFALHVIPALLLCSVGAVAQTPTAPPDTAGKPGMNSMAMAMTGDSDKDFAMMMKMHHQKGLAMAKKELANGKSPQMKAMAQKIIDAQTQEIADFDQWLAAHP
jgi:uncharacterized protein (DUF305 family)